MSNTVRIRAVLDDKVSSPLAKIRDNFDRLGKSKGAASILQGVGVGAGISAFNLLGSAVSGVEGIVISSIDAASALNETMSKSQVVFGDSADAVEKWGDTSAKAMGMSKQASIEAASTLGNLLLSMGNTSEEAAGMSEKMVQLAADLGSFNNVPAEDALLAIRSGLTGEMEPLRRFGVNLNDATLKTKAMSLGLYDGKGILDVNAKAQASYALILEQTTTAQGDFTRTAGGMANQQKILTAEMQNMSAELGEALIPYVIEAQKDLIAMADAGGILKEALAGASQETAGLTDKLVTMINTGFRPDKVIDFAASAQKAVTDFVTGAGDHLDHLKGKAEDDLYFTPLAGKAHDDLYRISAAIEHVGATFKSTTDDIIAIEKNLISNAFDPLSIKLDLIATNAEVSAARRAAATKGATNDERIALNDSLRSQAEGVLKMAETGQKGSKVYKDAVASLKRAAREATGPTKAYINAVIAGLNQVKKTGSSVPINFLLMSNGQPFRSGARASGGPVSAGSPYVVGEQGPEWFIPSGSGTILPNGVGPSGGGGSTVVHTVINLDGRVLANVVDEHLYSKWQRSPRTSGRV